MTTRPSGTRVNWLASERGYLLPAKGHAPLRIALVYPNTYHVGMSSLGFQLAHRVINDHPSARAERFFTDSLRFGSIETGSPLSDFNVIAFSGAYEMDGPHFLDVLESAGIPLLASERTEGGRWPLILAGGVLVSVNRLPLYPFIDAFIHGDAEVVLQPILDALGGSGADSRAVHQSRIEAIVNLPGVEVTPGALKAAGLEIEPSLEFAIRIPANRIEDSELPKPAAPSAPRLETLESYECSTQILTPHTEFSDMALVDLARGCPHHCTFCWIGHNSPPYRARRIDSIFAAIEAWQPMTDRFGLVSSAVGAHPQIDEICRWIMKRNLKVSYSSLRVEEVTPTMLEALAQGGQRTMTIAPEAGNMRVRRLLGKRISDEEIIDVVERAMSLGTENVKLYYMMGIPSETEEECMDIAAFSLRIREAMLKWGRRRGRVGYLGLNLGVFVPKPNLPLNHIEPIPLAEIKHRMKKLVRLLNKIPNTRLMVSSPDLAVAQTVLSTGGIEASRYLTIVRRHAGDWRAANREWRAEAEQNFERRKSESRIAAQTVRLRAGAAALP